VDSAQRNEVTAHSTATGKAARRITGKADPLDSTSTLRLYHYTFAVSTAIEAQVAITSKRNILWMIYCALNQHNYANCLQHQSKQGLHISVLRQTLPTAPVSDWQQTDCHTVSPHPIFLTRRIVRLDEMAVARIFTYLLLIRSCAHYSLPLHSVRSQMNPILVFAFILHITNSVELSTAREATSCAATR
jgi:hypothetical protein